MRRPGTGYTGVRRPEEESPGWRAPPARDAEEQIEKIAKSRIKQEEEEKKAQEEATKVAQEAEQKRFRCTSAMKRLGSLQRPRINAIAEDGTRSRMSEEWRQDEISKAQKVVDEACS